MRVLVACEYSGTVRDAFLRAGHDALSCDLLPTDVAGPHYQGDVLDIIGEGWDLMIAHPPCTFLTLAGVRWLHDPERFPTRRADMERAADFFASLLAAPVPRIAVENPVMHGDAIARIGRRPDQYIHPHEFGHHERKRTGLWLSGLPPLLADQDGLALTMSRPAAHRDRIHRAPPGPDRWKLRSTTYPGIAAAMVAQWGHL